ncbi:NAD(P)-dependent oxidoreductase [Salinisphaera hydrothermalis]|uniref:3-hydroxyisobutyrate dehydrogenase n=1 Tax=Salinisphaera hydrothermalis (strain C41B8) TaxID=1304275 RepID=A0A084IRL8_SALHC|nr:NAD(P)-dependent oxidoreductase [Salinisphaera hydrothermalis]KEZ79352.1 3-hydroxyisobutyrate dehydrogenase [Salinisphaera hydrothermalis C41B8]
MNTKATKKETIGFVGVGLMGHGIAANLLAEGYPLTAIAHRNRAPVDDLVGQGAQEATSVVGLAAASTVVFLCLTDSVAVESVVSEMESALKPGTVIVDCSTSDPVVTMRLVARLAERDVAYCDAPLGGTPDQAEAGELQAIVGAAPDVFERLEPVFACWTARTIHIGGVGDGHRMKLINNFISLGYGALYAEALSVARKAGLSIEQFDSVIRGSRMDCGFYRTFMGYSLEGNREAHKFTLTNAYKDMRYLEAMANNGGCTTPVSSAVKNSFAAAVAGGGDGPEDYVPHLTDYVARANGIAE